MSTNGAGEFAVRLGISLPKAGNTWLMATCIRRRKKDEADGSHDEGSRR